MGKWFLCIVTVAATTAHSQTPAPPAIEESVAPSPETQEIYDDPSQAYHNGAYEQALQGFVDLQVSDPTNQDLHLNIGNVHFQMGNFEEAINAFQAAAQDPDKKSKSEAYYSLGNTFFRQGKLDKAIEAFQSAIDHNPDDDDAKFNLEYTRDEIRRRHEQSKKQQEQNQNQDQDQQQNQDQQQDQDQQQNQNDEAPQDTDQDGLSDSQEENAQNPTDPKNPDSDGDGLTDAEEDKNKNGQVDKGETDPNKKDTDGDGIGDAQETQAQSDPGNGETSGEETPLTQEQAQRYLDSLGDQEKPLERKRRKGNARRRPTKDW